IVEDVVRMGVLSGRINEKQMGNLLAACDKIRTGVVQRYGVYDIDGYEECVPYVMSFTQKSPSDACTWDTDTFRNMDLFIQILCIEDIINVDGGKRSGHGLQLFKVKYDKQEIRDFFDRELTNLFYEDNEVKTETLVHLIVDQAIRYKPLEYSDECESRLVVMVPLVEIRARITNSKGLIPLNKPCMHSDSICDDIIGNEFGFVSTDEEIPCYLYIDPFEDRLGYQINLIMNPHKNLTISIPGWSTIGPTIINIEKDPTIKADTYILKKQERKNPE
ncbi:hypothetical protein, partial [Candidatus Methanarcanum hacksteinii]|uniref:hypothetical protein n=1 Tax=Candidatus Methanarcanum hacksteinii TaxID=2911857 RepID=UPI0037DC58AE